MSKTALVSSTAVHAAPVTHGSNSVADLAHTVKEGKRALLAAYTAERNASTLTENATQIAARVLLDYHASMLANGHIKMAVADMDEHGREGEAKKQARALFLEFLNYAFAAFLDVPNSQLDHDQSEKDAVTVDKRKSREAVIRRGLQFAVDLARLGYGTRAYDETAKLFALPRHVLTPKDCEVHGPDAMVLLDTAWFAVTRKLPSISPEGFKFRAGTLTYRASLAHALACASGKPVACRADTVAAARDAKEAKEANKGKSATKGADKRAEETPDATPPAQHANPLPQLPLTVELKAQAENKANTHTMADIGKARNIVAWLQGYMAEPNAAPLQDEVLSLLTSIEVAITAIKASNTEALARRDASVAAVKGEGKPAKNGKPVAADKSAA